MTRYPRFARPASIRDLVEAVIVDGRFDPFACRRLIDQLGPYAPAIVRNWDLLARDEQLPPRGDWTTWMYMAGRGAGKTRAGAEWVLRKIREGARIVHLVAPTEADYRDVMIRGESGLLSIAPPGERPRFYPAARRLEFPNGAYALCFSAEQPERLRGPQCEASWCDEVAAWRHAEATWDMMSFGL